MRLHLYHVKLAQTPFGKKWCAFLVVKKNPRKLGSWPVIIGRSPEGVMRLIADRLTSRKERVGDKRAILRELELDL